MLLSTPLGRCSSPAARRRRSRGSAPRTPSFGSPWASRRPSSGPVRSDCQLPRGPIRTQRVRRETEELGISTALSGICPVRVRTRSSQTYHRSRFVAAAGGLGACLPAVVTKGMTRAAAAMESSAAKCRPAGSKRQPVAPPWKFLDLHQLILKSHGSRERRDGLRVEGRPAGQIISQSGHAKRLPSTSFHWRKACWTRFQGLNCCAMILNYTESYLPRWCPTIRLNKAIVQTLAVASKHYVCPTLVVRRCASSPRRAHGAVPC